MRKKLFGLLSVLSFACALPVLADATVKCESIDGRYRECGVGAADSVRVLRTLSDTECRRGTSWGYLNGKIWVDNGCRAEFVVSNSLVSDRNDILVCESIDGKRKHCPADTRGGVMLTRRLSDSSCDYKNDWDYDKNGVWVRHGCRAEFSVRNGGSIIAHTSSPPPLPMGQTMLMCESKNGRRSHCPADTRFGASLYQQLSESSCIFNSTWGFDSKGVWVTSGCRGQFAVNTLQPQTSAVIHAAPVVVATTTVPVGHVLCESINNGFKKCDADTRFGASLARQISDNACVYNSTWGFDSNGIWVKNGCRGEFATAAFIAQTTASVNASASSSLVRCESKNNGRSMCPADTRFGVAVFRQLSDNNCILNSTWGFDSKGIWVNGGCRADFVLNP